MVHDVLRRPRQRLGRGRAAEATAAEVEYLRRTLGPEEGGGPRRSLRRGRPALALARAGPRDRVDLSGDAVEALRRAGCDVLWVTTDLPGGTDREVLARAAVERRVLLTFDKDFGELVFRTGLRIEGLVLFRLHQVPLEERSRLAVLALLNRADWAGWFSVVQRDRIRSVPLPPARGREEQRR